MPAPPREIETLFWLSKGMNRREISECMGIVITTVDANLASVRKKLSATTLAHSVRVCQEDGYFKQVVSLMRYDREYKSFRNSRLADFSDSNFDLFLDCESSYPSSAFE